MSSGKGQQAPIHLHLGLLVLERILTSSKVVICQESHSLGSFAQVSWCFTQSLSRSPWLAYSGWGASLLVAQVSIL